MSALTTCTVTSDAGGRMATAIIKLGRFRLAVGWVTKWTPQIKWLYRRKSWNVDYKEQQIHIGRFRIGLAIYHHQT